MSTLCDYIGGTYDEDTGECNCASWETLNEEGMCVLDEDDDDDGGGGGGDDDEEEEEEGEEGVGGRWWWWRR
ncbi:MAG: hypothetical protein J4G12_07455 [Gemmatimonadetes bacterium]|nr:hypothetical protein [Gemmatimonadota bacterium]